MDRWVVGRYKKLVHPWSIYIGDEPHPSNSFVEPKSFDYEQYCTEQLMSSSYFDPIEDSIKAVTDSDDQGHAKQQQPVICEVDTLRDESIWQCFVRLLLSLMPTWLSRDSIGTS